jgi:hypothetical protein
MSATWFPGITPSREMPAETGPRAAHLELVPPGIVPMAEWRAEGEPGPHPAPAEASAYAAIARKN